MTMTVDRRREAERLFEKQKEERLERVRRKRRTDEEANKTLAAGTISRKRKVPNRGLQVVPARSTRISDQPIRAEG